MRKPHCGTLLQPPNQDSWCPDAKRRDTRGHMGAGCHVIGARGHRGCLGPQKLEEARKHPPQQVTGAHSPVTPQQQTSCLQNCEVACSVVAVALVPAAGGHTAATHPPSLLSPSLPAPPLPPCFPSQGATALLFPSLSLNPPACVMLTWAQGYLWGDHRLHGAQPHSTPTQAPYGGGGQRRWRAGWVWALPTLKNPSDTSLTKPQVKDENKDFKMEAAIKLLPPCRATGPVTGLVTHPGGQS